MILVGSAYQNSLVNLLAFFLLAIVFLAMGQTHDNIKQIVVDSSSIADGYAGGEQTAVITLSNLSAKATRYQIDTRLKRRLLQRFSETSTRISPKGQCRQSLTYTCPSRGLHRETRVRLSTRYPLGLFEAWSWKNIELPYFVYPAPIGDRPLPEAIPALVDSMSNTFEEKGLDQEDFHGHRIFQLGDSERRIDWRAFARGRPRLVKEFKGSHQALTNRDLNWNSLSDLAPEARLSQLTRWVELALAQNLRFSLTLPGVRVAPGSGHLHATKCLECLAVFELPDHGSKLP